MMRPNDTIIAVTADFASADQMDTVKSALITGMLLECLAKLRFTPVVQSGKAWTLSLYAPGCHHCVPCLTLPTSVIMAQRTPRKLVDEYKKFLTYPPKRCKGTSAAP